MKLDEIDKKILNILQIDARITNVQLASEVGISPPAMLERVRRLETNGVVRQYVALLDSEKINRRIITIVAVSLSMHQNSSIDNFIKQIKKLDEVLECYHISGEGDFLLKIISEDMQSYERFLLEQLTKIKGVNKVSTTFVLSTIKFNTKISIE